MAGALKSKHKSLLIEVGLWLESDQVGHQTTNASIENKHFFTK